MHVHLKQCLCKFPVCFATMYSLDLTNLIECRNYTIIGFVLLNLCRKTENLAFNKKQFDRIVFAFDSKCSKPNNLLKSFKILSHLK